MGVRPPPARVRRAMAHCQPMLADNQNSAVAARCFSQFSWVRRISRHNFSKLDAEARLFLARHFERDDFDASTAGAFYFLLMMSTPPTDANHLLSALSSAKSRITYSLIAPIIRRR